jgi:hypothetical protein
VDAGLYEMGAEFLACVPLSMGHEGIPQAWYQNSGASKTGNGASAFSVCPPLTPDN